MRKITNAETMRRYQIIVNLADGRPRTETAKAVGVSRSTVYRVAKRFREHGESGLADRREDNGTDKLDDAFLNTLYEVVAGCPLDHGETRSGMSMAKSVKNKTFEPNPKADSRTSRRRSSRLRGRSRCSFESENRQRLDGARSAKTGDDSGEKREALRGRCDQREDG